MDEDETHAHERPLMTSGNVPFCCLLASHCLGWKNTEILISQDHPSVVCVFSLRILYYMAIIINN